MPLPPLRITDVGFTYCDDLLGHKVCTGSKQGLPDYLPVDREAPIKLRMAQVRMVDHDYAPNGAYFGAVPGLTLYHVESVEEVLIDQASYWTGSDPGHVRTVRMFLKAINRQTAKEEVRRALPNASFYR